MDRIHLLSAVKEDQATAIDGLKDLCDLRRHASVVGVVVTLGASNGWVKNASGRRNVSGGAGWEVKRRRQNLFEIWLNSADSSKELKIAVHGECCGQASVGFDVPQQTLQWLCKTDEITPQNRFPFLTAPVHSAVGVRDAH
jgi:hypothetical protein